MVAGRPLDPYTTWTTTGGHIKRVAASGGQTGNIDANEGYYLDPTYMPDGTRIVFLSGAASISSTRSAARRLPTNRQRRRRAEIGGVNPPNTLEIRWMSPPAAPRRSSRRHRTGALRTSRATIRRAST
jgi:hypothetical protein